MLMRLFYLFSSLVQGDEDDVPDDEDDDDDEADA